MRNRLMLSLILGPGFPNVLQRQQDTFKPVIVPETKPALCYHSLQHLEAVMSNVTNNTTFISRLHNDEIVPDHQYRFRTGLYGSFGDRYMEIPVHRYGGIEEWEWYHIFEQQKTKEWIATPGRYQQSTAMLKRTRMSSLMQGLLSKAGCL